MSISKKEPLSDSWRIDPSHIQALDLANVLRSLIKVVGLVDAGDHDVNVSFSNKPGQESAFFPKSMSIVLNPEFAIKSSPVEGEDFDVLTGEAVHEALHSLCQSEQTRSSGTISGTLDQVTMIGEEVYIDNYGKRNFPVLGKYIRLTREAHTVDSERIDWEDLFATWIATSVYGMPPPDIAFKGTKRLPQIQILMELTTTLMNKDMIPRARRNLYVEVSARLADLQRQGEIEDQLSSPPPLELESPYITETQLPKEEGEQDDSTNSTPDSPETSQDSSDQKGEDQDSPDKPEETEDDEDEEEESDEQGEVNSPGKASSDGEAGDSDDDAQEMEGSSGNGDIVVGEGVNQIQDITKSLHPKAKPLPPELAKAISDAIDTDMQDMTAALEEEYGLVNDFRGGNIIWQKALTALDPDFNQSLANQLRWLKEFKNTVGHQTYHNEPRGKVDQQRIYRAPIDGLIFKVQRELPKSDLDLVLLLDASSSMNGSNSELYEDAKALFKSLPETTILSYRHAPNGVMITKHTEGRAFHGIMTHGGTPSGIALAATATRYPKSLIIHFTDGDSNVGVDPYEIIPKIGKMHPAVKIINIHLRGSSHPIRNFENSTSIVMDSISDFPNKLKEALKTWR